MKLSGSYLELNFHIFEILNFTDHESKAIFPILGSKYWRCGQTLDSFQPPIVHREAYNWKLSRTRIN